MSCDIIQLWLSTKKNGTLHIIALVLPFICHPLTSRPISLSGEHCEHLEGLDLADSVDISDTLEIDMLIGSDLY